MALRIVGDLEHIEQGGEGGGKGNGSRRGKDRRAKGRGSGTGKRKWGREGRGRLRRRK